MGDAFDDVVGFAVSLLFDQQIEKADQAFVVDLVQSEAFAEAFLGFIQGLFHLLGVAQVEMGKRRLIVEFGRGFENLDRFVDVAAEELIFAQSDLLNVFGWINFRDDGVDQAVLQGLQGVRLQNETIDTSSSAARATAP